MKGRINLALVVGARAAAVPTATGKAPDRFRIWRAGANPGDYGECNFTAAAAAAVMADFSKRGNAGAIDVEHATNSLANPKYDPANPPPGGGYYSLELVDTKAGPELWASSVRWSEYARAQIETGSRCYVSPDWLMSQDTREPYLLNKLSLVMEPGTYGINLLASAGANRGSKNMDEIDKLRAAYAAMMAMASSTDPDIKASAAALCEKLKANAATLGIDLEAAGPEAELPATDLPASRADATPAPAGGTTQPAKFPPGASAAAARGVTLAEVTSVIREENAKRDMLAANAGRPGLTQGLVQVLAGKSLREAREIIGALPPKLAPVVEKVPPAPLNATAGAAAVATGGTQPAAGVVAEDKPTAEEAHDIDKMRRQFGLSVEAVTASRASLAAGEGGVLSIARLRALKAAGVAETASKVAAAK